MLPASFIDMLQKIVSGEYGVNPTLIYNEGWMLRLLLHYPHEGVSCFPIPSDAESKWFSEVQLPTAFKARHRGDPLSENRTNVDGVYGHLKIKTGTKSGLLLDKKAKSFVVLEAKMFSPSPPGFIVRLTLIKQPEPLPVWRGPFRRRGFPLLISAIWASMWLRLVSRY
ncbi:hypothetical protein E4H04_05860 [Candidatus Bathyarchaeota archaeon]|nr:MAG: hypothetical protein E4H04_05860 [Candidatus Bathyarchaeota archaeon]